MTSHSHHPFHLVELSPWPLTASIGALSLTTGLAYWFHNNSIYILILSLSILTLSSYQWWRDISREGTFQGFHNPVVVTNLRWGMIFFIISEIFFFLSFFWAFFHSSLAPSVEIGTQWPPTGIIPFNPFQIPLLNTAVLLSSGVTITWSHHALMNKNHSQSIQALSMTIILGIYFTFLQAYEYMEASFSISEAIYGTTFFVATGFHGLHVIIGSTFLMICLYRMLKFHFSPKHHFGFEAAAWYWHFVDVVWLFLYVSIYWWGG
uniref:cytochrome c oxidase subunit III n=1 Tax=Ashinkailepas seepiophila TaxID=479252 RepID=UPI0021CC6A42|nr:cytochrome c oxidase subunit III [Ashinkailepas seepiophila]UWM12887.1 cytochrome c oxidase subunit III [Ashinkailepas seepiophila]